MFLHAESEDSDKTMQTGQMPRLIGVFAGRIVILLVLSWRGSRGRVENQQATRGKEENKRNNTMSAAS